MARRSGRGETPTMVVDLLKHAVEKSSQAEMSRILGVGVATINRFVHGVGEPTQETMERLAGYFSKTVAELRGQELPGGASSEEAAITREMLLEIYNLVDRRFLLCRRYPGDRTEADNDLALAERAIRWSVFYKGSDIPDVEQIAKQLGLAADRLKSELEPSQP